MMIRPYHMIAVAPLAPRVSSEMELSFDAGDGFGGEAPSLFYGGVLRSHPHGRIAMMAGLDFRIFGGGNQAPSFFSQWKGLCKSG